MTPSTHRIQQSQHLRRMVSLALLSALSLLLFFFEFSVPLAPMFLKLDLSEVAALIAAFAYGPLAGVLVEFTKNLLHLPFTQTAMVGEIANFVVGSVFVVIAGSLYRWKRSRQGAVLGMSLATLGMAISGVLINYSVTLPFFMKLYQINMDQILMASRAAGNIWVNDVWTLLLFVFVPFNLFKGLIVSILVSLVYKKLSPWLHRED